MKKDNIEDIYNELGAFSKEPPKELWDNIEARLHPKKKKRRLFILWSSGAAAILLLIGYVFTDSLDFNNKPVKDISDIEQPKVNDKINEPNIETIKIVEETEKNDIKEDSLLKAPNTIKELLKKETGKKQLSDRSELLNLKEKGREKGREKGNKEHNAIAKNDFRNKSSKNEEKSKNSIRYAQVNDKMKPNQDGKNNNLIPQKNESIANNKKEKEIASNDSISNTKEASPFVLIEELLAENKEENDSINLSKPTGLKWSVEVLGGLSNTASDASIQGTSVNTTSQNDFVYSLKVGYALSDRLVVKSGIGKNILGQEINNIKYTSSDISSASPNAQSIVNNQSILFLVSEESINDFTTTVEFTNEGDLQQQFDYVQIPLEFSYDVLRAQKFDVSLGVGGNINFLTNNRAFLDNEQIGESLGVDATIFGAMLNTNISYRIAKKTNLFLEPSYNYFDKPIDNNNQTFNNTQLRVLFGLRYKF